jgi:hypothetical protein
MEQDGGHFFRSLDPTTGRRERVVWCGPIDLALIKLMHDRAGDVPAPFWMDEHRGAAPREMIEAQFVRKPDIVGPMSLRHLREMSVWRRPTTWPLLAAVHDGRVADLYHAHFCIVPASSMPTPAQFKCLHFHAYDWPAWCKGADELGFLGVETNEGYEPFLLVLSATLSRQFLADPTVPTDRQPPTWAEPLFAAGAPPRW